MTKHVGRCRKQINLACVRLPHLCNTSPFTTTTSLEVTHPYRVLHRTIFRKNTDGAREITIFQRTPRSLQQPGPPCYRYHALECMVGTVCGRHVGRQGFIPLYTHTTPSNKHTYPVLTYIRPPRRKRGASSPCPTMQVIDNFYIPVLLFPNLRP